MSKQEEIHMQVVTDVELRSSGYRDVVSLAKAIWSKDNDVIPPSSQVIGVYRDHFRRITEVYFRCVYGN